MEQHSAGGERGELIWQVSSTGKEADKREEREKKEKRRNDGKDVTWLLIPPFLFPYFASYLPT